MKIFTLIKYLKSEGITRICGVQDNRANVSNFSKSTNIPSGGGYNGYSDCCESKCLVNLLIRSLL